MRMRSLSLLRSGALPALLAFLPGLASCHGGLASAPPVAPPQAAVVAAASPPFEFPDYTPVENKDAPLPPMRLTASDGTGLRLTAITARAVVEAPLGFTELHLVFDNPEDRTLEGNFSITLPPGATLSRFAMKLGSVWQEGEVVEKKAARAAYEDFLHRKQDPALLEQAEGNEFSARVFPIPARGRKELILSYAQEITPETPYAIPLRGLPELGQLDVEVTTPESPRPVQELKQMAFVPSADFKLDAKLAPAAAGLRAGELVLARIHPVAQTDPEPLGPTLILVDTSASRALGFDEQIALVKKLAAKIAESAGPKTPLVVACFDQTVDAIFDGEAGGFGARELKRIRTRQALGASNLERALGWAAERAKAHGTRRVLLLGDGVPTAGATEGDRLRAAAAGLKAGGVERLDALAVGGIRDEALLKRLVTAGLSHDGTVTDGAKDMATIERRLTRATRSGVAVNVEGATWSWPKKLDGVQAGDEVLVYAEVPADKPVSISVDGAPAQGMELAKVEKPLLQRAVVEAKIAGLLERQAVEGDKPEIQKQIVALSVGYRVLSPYTGLLVLETERDYARFDIDRDTAADILMVDQGRVAVAHRAALGSDPQAPAAAVARAKPKSPPKPSPAPKMAMHAAPGDPLAPGVPWGTPSAGNDPLAARGNMWGSEIGDSFGAGGLGLAGIGEGGGGTGEGIGLGAVGTLGHGAGAGAAATAAPLAPPPPPPPMEVSALSGSRSRAADLSASGGGFTAGPAIGSGSGQGFGSGHGRLGGSHSTAAPTVRMGATQVSGRLPPESIQRVVRLGVGRMRACYEDGLRRDPRLAGRVAVRFVIDRTGAVAQAEDAGSSLGDGRVVACVVRQFFGLSFPAPESGNITVVYPLVFSGPGGDSAAEAPPPPEPPPPPPPPPPSRRAHVHSGEAEAYTGRMKPVMEDIARGDAKAAIDEAYAWHRQDPGDVMGLVGLGEALEAAGEISTAARAYGSIVDLFPARADLRRFAGERLERLRGDAGLALALDTFEKARAERPDHPASHRLLAFALLKEKEYEKAFAAAVEGVKQPYPQGRFLGVDRILREDVGLIAAAWMKAEPARRGEILAKVNAAGGDVEDEPSLRFVLNWETDANDVDFHIFDADGGHAYYSQPNLPSGGSLYADVTTGYGPECFTIRGPAAERSPTYTLQAHYYSRGPMGYGMGKLQIIDHDGKGGITIEERPFVAMSDHAFVELGQVKR